MELKFKCRYCDSGQLDVAHEWEEFETGCLYLVCGCEDGDRAAAEVKYTANKVCTREHHFDGTEWYPEQSVDAQGEVSFSDMVVRCSACHEGAEFPRDYETADNPEVEVDEDSHQFRIHCATCHAPIQCIGAIEEFVKQAIVG